MGVTVKNLGVGQLPNATGDLYTVPALTQAIVTSISFANTNTTAETMYAYYLASGGTKRLLSPNGLVVAAGSQVEILLKNITLGAGDKIQGNTTTASKVDYVISGVEIS